MNDGTVVWITGLSASGKTTLLRVLQEQLTLRGVNPICLDGDDLRRVLRLEGHSYERDERLALAFQYADMCRYLAQQGHIVLIATIALFREIHTWNRENLPNYLEVLMDFPLAELEARDPKGLYRRFRRGEVKNVAGVDMPVDLPESPHFRVACPARGLVGISAEIADRILERHATQ